jgi:hypothetical protein
MHQHTEGHWRGGTIFGEDFCASGGPKLDEDYHTTIYVNNAAAIASTPGQYLIMIDSEVMEVTNVDVATGALTVVRGFDGTTAATHADNADVYLATDQRGDLWITQDIGAYAYYGT